MKHGVSGVRMEAGTSEEVTTVVQEGNDASLDQGDRHGGDDSGLILRAP